MRRLIKIWLAVATVLALAAAPAAAGGISLKRGVNLDIWDTWPDEERWGERAVLLPYPEWRRKLDAGDMAALKRSGFDFVRIPVDPAPFLSARTELFRDALYHSVLQAARTVTGAGLRAVIDLHAIPAGERSSGSDILAEDAALFDRYVKFTERMARTLSGEDADMLALELMNEPLAGCDGGGKRWSEMLRRLHGAARDQAERLTLVLPGGCWSTAESLAEIDPKAFRDGNVIWTFHSYAPFLLTHQGAGWAGDLIRFVSGIPYPPFGENARERDAALEGIRDRIRTEAPFIHRSGMLSYLDKLAAEIDTSQELNTMMAEPFETAARWADANGIERENIMLGEFGMIRQEYQTPNVMRPEWRAAYVADMIGLAEEHGFSWAIWGYGGAFGIVEAFEGRAAEPDVLDVVRRLR